ncbi:UPF0664 stress-induced protein [Colletotrichum orbiculare MAFF 240422]|uniref:UPF0664 stress-induced protein n=1 Tax=Colletotrichum orbiculare (strain 104-T / ATCC 96160 / CBS 514.97 / LARS 414 / MAFF 240422) TaxID=1213857 RepID=A0A484FH31_COLOR|nr:UPF0664 stress-induced protein [Colletotrichum orbiculare MAFF 240422]
MEDCIVRIYTHHLTLARGIRITSRQRTAALLIRSYLACSLALPTVPTIAALRKAVGVFVILCLDRNQAALRLASPKVSLLREIQARYPYTTQTDGTPSKSNVHAHAEVHALIHAASTAAIQNATPLCRLALHRSYALHLRALLPVKMSINWVMITQTGEINPLPHEHIRHRSNSKITLELSVPKSLQQGRTPFTRKSDNGTVYITNQRLIYIPAKPTPEFKSFHAPILNCMDTYVGSPFFGAWYWSATVVPVAGGGVPHDVPRIELKLSFKEGGHSEFRQRFEELKERLEHPLPAYEATEGGGAAPSANNLAPEQSVGRSASTGSQNRRPNEPPPDYEEAQAQTLSMRLEDHIREESDRA